MLVDHVNCFQPGRKSLIYIIPEKPIPWARTGLNNHRIYDAQKKHKLLIGLQIKEQHEEYGADLFTGPLELQIFFYFSPPKKAKVRGLNNLHQQYKVSKPDVDNLAKFYIDVCTGILYTDDSLICSLTAKKLYDDGDQRTELIITEGSW